MNTPAPVSRILFFKAHRIEELLLKRTDMPAGSRWITVRPNGPGTKGVPLLISAHPKKPGVWSVIGGAGGKLNYLELRGIKAGQTYKEEARARQKTQRALEKQRISRDKKAGIHQSKTKQKKLVAAQRETARREFVSRVAQMAGWDQAKIAFQADKYQHLSPKAQQTMQRKHEAVVFKAAKEVVKQQRQALLADVDRHKQLRGAIQLEPSDADAISVTDLDPVKAPDSGMGFVPTYRQRAEKRAGGKC